MDSDPGTYWGGGYTASITRGLAGFEVLGELPSHTFSRIPTPAAFSVTAWARWTDPGADDEHRVWARNFSNAMEPYATDGVYVNFLSRQGDERVEAAYGDNHDELATVKAKYDPKNLFRMNQNIEPRG